MLLWRKIHMLTKWIDFSIQNRVFILLSSLILIAIGVFSLKNTPIDALPDLSDVQVIIYTEHSGQSPKIIEDQVTYPLTTTLVSVPGAKTIRGYSFFGYSLVYVIFEDGTDLYWARSRVLETLNAAQQRLPEGVLPTLGPDASGVGWVYEYALVSKKHSLQELRSIQDWFLKYQLSGVPGVSEVASVGGFVKQYQVTVIPERLQNYGIRLSDVEKAVQDANGDEGGEAIEIGEAEFMIRGLGYIKSVEDLELVPLLKLKGKPTVYLKDVANINIGPEMRRGIVDLDGKGEVVGGIVVMRSGQNALKVIEGVKKKLKELQGGLPEGVEIVATYDRSNLILSAIKTLKDKLLEEILVVSLVCLLFLLHARSALVAVFVLPTSILIAFIVMHIQGLNANIMSLGGIAIAIGAMVDAAIIMIENAHKNLEYENLKPENERLKHWDLIAKSSKEVGPTLFFSLLLITISFIPVFSLGEQEGRLFKPLAFTKTYAMAAASLLSLTVVPVLMGYFVRGKILPERKNPINRFLEKIYHPIVKFVLTHPYKVLLVSLFVLLSTLYPFKKLGSEFMPPLREGDILYMPTTFPGISIEKAKALLHQTDKLIASIPEVEQVFGKVGRAETATDPADLDMLETTIRLKPQSQWRKGYTYNDIIKELDKTVNVPGLTNSWIMPIKARTDMLSTGINTPVGLKISGPNTDTLQLLGEQAEAIIREIPGTISAFSERAMSGNYMDVKINRQEAARHGVSVADIQKTLKLALAGMRVTTTVEGLERYSINIRYPRELRDSPEKISRILVDLPNGGSLPLSMLADISLVQGPMFIRSENSRPNSWVFVDIEGDNIGAYVHHAHEILSSHLELPNGYTFIWSGEFEYMERMYERLSYVIPITLFLIFLLLFLNTKSFVKTGIVLLAIPFSLIGAIWILCFLDYNMSLAVWIGMIALAGLDAETGVIMLLYLDKAYEKVKKESSKMTLPLLYKAIDLGAVRRIRPKMMTASVILAGLIPILWSQGSGADVMKRIAAPMVGGVVSSVLMELLVYPAIYFLWKKRKLEVTT